MSRSTPYRDGDTETDTRMTVGGVDVDVGALCRGETRVNVPSAEPFQSINPRYVAYERVSSLPALLAERPGLAVPEAGPDGDTPLSIWITDCGDADGMMAGALAHHTGFEHVVTVPASVRGGWGLAPHRALQMVFDRLDRAETETVHIPVYVADLQPPANENGIVNWLKQLQRVDNPVRVRDHHQYSEKIAYALDSHPGEYVHREDQSAAEIVRDVDCGELPQKLDKAVTLSAVRDKGLSENDRWDTASRYAELAYNVSYPVGVEIFAEHGDRFDACTGECLPSEFQPSESISIGKELNAVEALKQAQIEWCLENAEQREIAGHTTVLGFGQCSQTDFGTVVCDRFDAEIAVLLKPAGDLSFRVRDGGPSIVGAAEAMSGGGHDHAAGASVFAFEDGDEDAFEPDPPISQEHHVKTEGQLARALVSKVLREHFQEQETDA